MRKRFYRPTNQNLSGKRKILKIGPLGAEKTFMQKSNEKHLSGLGLRKMNVTPLAILSVKWPFSKGRGR